MRCLDLESTEPERLILKIPKQLWLLRSRPAFCMTRNRASIFLMASIVYGFFLVISRYYFFASFLQNIFDVIVWTIFFSMSILWILPTIFIRKDCFECQFGFHIIAHERNHLLSRKSEEIGVEEVTLKQTGDRLIPILLSNPKICKGCPFSWCKMYSQETFNYLKRKAESN